jgi:hypothetical protein
LLNRQNAEYEQALLEVRRSERPVEKWMSQNAAHQAAVERLGQVQQERADVRSELRRLNRLKAVMSDLLDFQEAEARLKALAHVKELPEDAFQRRLEVSAQVTEFQAEARRIAEDLRAFEEEFNALPEDSSICEVDDAQLELAARIGTAIAARKDLPKRRAALLEQERQIGVLLRELGQNVELGAELLVARRVLVGAEVSGTVGRLVSQYSGLSTHLEGVEARLRKVAKQISELNAMSEEQSDGDRRRRLEALFAQAKAAQVSQVEMRQDEKLLARSQVQIERIRAELECTAPFQTLARHLPSQEFFVQRVTALQEQRRLYGVAIKERPQLESALEECVSASSKGSTIPTDGVLLEAREGRAGSWMLCEQGLRNGPSFITRSSGPME